MMQSANKNKRKFLDNIFRVLKKYRMLEPGDSLVVGVSGGIDSITLLHVLNELKDKLRVSLHVAHFNHNLRGEESLRDARFVESLARQLDLPYALESGSVREFARLHKISIEGAARTLRYQFFHGVAEKVGANKIVTAHTADDQAETLLLRLLQGAGLAGLSGIWPVLNHPYRMSCQIIRPFIETTRDEIERFAREEKLKHVTDSSNLDKRHLRNKIRLDLLPLLKQEFNPQVTMRLAATADLLRDDLDLLNRLAEESYTRVCKQGESQEVLIDLSQFTLLHPALQKRVLRKGFEELTGTARELESRHVQSAMDLLKYGKIGKSIDLPGGIQVRKAYGQGIIAKRLPKTRKSVLSEKTGFSMHKEEVLVVPGIQQQKGLIFSSQILSVNGGEDPCVHLKEKASSLGLDSFTAFFDYDKLKLPLWIRKRKPGDRFQPLGMKGQKKLQDLLVDLKVPTEKRDLVPILQDKEGIVWVIGYRIAERVKVDSETQKILFCTVTSPITN